MIQPLFAYILKKVETKPLNYLSDTLFRSNKFPNLQLNVILYLRSLKFCSIWKGRLSLVEENPDKFNRDNVMIIME